MIYRSGEVLSGEVLSGAVKQDIVWFGSVL